MARDAAGDPLSDGRSKICARAGGESAGVHDVCPVRPPLRRRGAREGADDVPRELRGELFGRDADYAGVGDVWVLEEHALQLGGRDCTPSAAVSASCEMERMRTLVSLSISFERGA